MKKLLLTVCIIGLLAAGCAAPEITAPVVISAAPGKSAQPSKTAAPEEPEATPRKTAAKTPTPAQTPTAPSITEFKKWDEDLPKTIAADMDGDGQEETVSFETVEDDGGAVYHNVKIKDHDGKEYEEKIQAEGKFALARVAIGNVNPGDQWKELFITGEKGQAGFETYCIRFDGNGIQKTIAEGKIEGIQNGGIVLGKDVNILGVWYGVGLYEISKEFKLEPVEGALWQNTEGQESSFPIRVKKEFQCEAMADGQTEPASIPKGTMMQPISTDNKTLVYTRTDDGRYLKIRISTEEGKVKINGIPAEKLLEVDR